MALDETDDVYFRFLLCKPSSLISCHLVPKLRTSGPSPETSLQGTALHFSTNSSSNSYRIVRLGVPVWCQLKAARGLSSHYNVYERYKKVL